LIGAIFLEKKMDRKIGDFPRQLGSTALMIKAMRSASGAHLSI